MCFSSTDENKKIDILEACRMSKQAWDSVSSKTIANCFRKAGFIHNNNSELLDNGIEQAEQSDFVNEVYIQAEKNVPYEQYINFDNDLAVSGTLTDTDIVKEIICDNESSEEEDEVFLKPKVTITQALNSISQLNSFIEEQENVDDEIFQSINKLRNFTMLHKIKTSKQTNLHDYFKK